MARYTAPRPANKETLDKLEGTFLKLLEGAKPSAEVRYTHARRPLSSLAVFSVLVLFSMVFFWGGG